MLYRENFGLYHHRALTDDLCATRSFEVLRRASQACHDLLMSDRRTRAEPLLQLSLFCDAGALMRDLYDLAPDPVLLDRSVRCWQACVQYFHDPSEFPSLALLNVGPRLDLVVMNLAAARMKRFQLNHLGEDLNDAIQHFTFAVLVTLPDSPLLPSRLAALRRVGPSRRRRVSRTWH